MKNWNDKGVDHKLGGKGLILKVLLNMNYSLGESNISTSSHA